MDEVIKALEQLARRDRRCRVFGAQQHRYRRIRVTPAEIDEFERALRVTLPDEYRTFLSTYGHGPGPYYGCWSPKKCMEELGGNSDLFAAEGMRQPGAERLFPLRLAGDTRGEPREATFPADGMVPIGHQGCTFWSVLVTAGEYRGTVWDAACFVGIDGEYLPARRPTGILLAGRELPPLKAPATFGEWYMSWIERSLADLQAAPSRNWFGRAIGRGRS